MSYVNFVRNKEKFKICVVLVKTPSVYTIQMIIFNMQNHFYLFGIINVLFKLKNTKLADLKTILNFIISVKK